MITLLTGLPGNGKTLFALWYIKQKAEKEQREVYYHNIKDLTLPWTVFEPEKWMDLPKGSIIVFDEAQFVFPKKPNGAKPPLHYEELSTHRHHGFDIFVITQHPSLVDNFVRQLVGQHFHAVRKFGLDRATVYEWSAVSPAPQTPASQKSAISLKWAYPKEVYSYYKSAEVHTVKKAIPVKIFLALGFVLFVAFAGWWAMHKYGQRYEKPADQVQAQSAHPAGPGAVNVVDTVNPNTNNTNKAPFDRMADAREYVAMNTPRVPGLPQTAPKFDPLTVPVRVPVPAACVQIGTASSGKTPRCQCYTQQGTRMEVEYNMCISFAQNGWFREFDADKDKAGDDRQRQPVALVQSAPQVVESPRPPISGGSSYVVTMDSSSGATEQRAPAAPDPAPASQNRVRKAFAPAPSA